MTMTCVDHSMVRRGPVRAAFLSVPATFTGLLAVLAWWRSENIEDLSDHMLRDIGFADGRATEAGMRRASERRLEIDRF